MDIDNLSAEELVKFAKALGSHEDGELVSQKLIWGVVKALVENVDGELPVPFREIFKTWQSVDIENIKKQNLELECRTNAETGEPFLIITVEGQEQAEETNLLA